MTNITKELNESICPIAEDCLFYTKPIYHTPSEVNFYKDYCLKGGGKCGLKRNWEKTSELRKRLDFPRDKKTWRSK